jgi:heat shock protein HtpX
VGSDEPIDYEHSKRHQSVAIAFTSVLSKIERTPQSGQREYLADAGSVDLTKNPDAMISALQKISGNAGIHAPSEVREMFIENPQADFASLFATHPPIQDRINALVKYAGGHIIEPAVPETPAVGPWNSSPPPPDPSAPRQRGPWG